MPDPVGQSVGSRQVVKARGPAEYELTGVEIPPYDDMPICRHCGAVIVEAGGEWYTPTGRWPNLNYCHRSARNGASVPHAPESEAEAPLPASVSATPEGSQRGRSVV